MDKFGRNYSLRVQSANLEDFKTIELPFTVDFNIVRKNFSSANSASIRVFNLNEKSRDQIRFNKVNAGLIVRSIVLSAGYGENLTNIFSGHIKEAYSVRAGVDFLTIIDAFDGGISEIRGIADELPPFKAGTQIKDVIRTLINILPDVEEGAIGSFPGELQRDQSYSGSIFENLQNLTNGKFFIDSGKAYALGPNEAFEGPLKTINADTGLLSTPRREENFITFEILFEPGVIVGQEVTLESLGTPALNGRYKITSIEHKGMISESAGSKLVTTLGLQVLDFVIEV